MRKQPEKKEWSALTVKQRQQVCRDFGPGTNCNYSLQDLLRPAMRYVEKEDGRVTPLDPYVLARTFSTVASRSLRRKQ